MKKVSKRYILHFNERQTGKDAADRQAIIESLEEKISSAPQSLVGNKGYSKYLKVTRSIFRIDKNKVEADKRLDGKWVLQTNTDLDTTEMCNIFSVKSRKRRQSAGINLTTS